MDVTVGRIISTFKARPRRYVLFFEDIMANYIKECDTKGYGKEIGERCKKSMSLVAVSIAPTALKKLPLTLVMNRIAKRIWINIGGVDDLYVTKKGNIVTIRMKNGQITRVIGKNSYTIGLLTGIFNVLNDCEMECIRELTNNDWSEYVFQVKNKQRKIILPKEKQLYNKLNYFKESEGVGFKDALKKGTLLLKEANRIYFREKSIMMLENTLFHILSNSHILMDRIPHLSYEFFKDVIEKDSSNERKLILLKNLLQAMGWGIIGTYMVKDNEISINIRYPPYGLQREKDNWDFLIKVILGYMWLLDKRFEIKKVDITNRILKIDFSVN